MLKLCILLALTVAGSVHGQEAGSEAAPEPYAYAYETESHAASEQRDPSGKVTGFYTLTDADGRARRVEYYADESGFHAKVQTNEVGTKSENSADVEVQASPPTAEQVYQTTSVQAAPAPVPVAAVQQQRYVYQQNAVAQPYRAVSNVQYFQQPGYNYGYNYGYYPGYSYGGYTGQKYGYGAVRGVANGVVGGVYNSGAQYTTTGAVVPVAAAGYGVNSYGVGNYNYHTPSSYYARYSSSSVQPASTYGVVSGSRYVTSNVATVPGTATTYSVGVPGSVSYSAGVAPVGSVSAAVPGVSAGLGSSNYIVLKKRETEK